MILFRKIVVIALLLLLSMGVSAQVASVAEKEVTVAERNAAQGFNDTIDRLAPPYAGILLVWCLVMSGEFFWEHILVDWPHIILTVSFCVVLLKPYLYRYPEK